MRNLKSATTFPLVILSLLYIIGWKDTSVDHVWIGGRLVNRVWTWYGIVSGQVIVDYWGYPDPNGERNTMGLCIVTWAQYYWGDNPCEYLRSYVCERQLKA